MSYRNSGLDVMTQYIAARQICFSPLSFTSLKNFKHSPKNYTQAERSVVDGWMTPSVRGTIQSLQCQVLSVDPDPEATLEYNLRYLPSGHFSFAIGLYVPVNAPKALFYLFNIIEGAYPNTIKAKAASLAAACFLDAFTRDISKGDVQQDSMAIRMANFSCEMGLFSEIAYYLVEEALLFAPNASTVLGYMKKNVRHLLSSYKEFIASEGVKIAAGRYWKVHRPRCTPGSDGRLSPVYIPPVLGAVERLITTNCTQFLDIHGKFEYGP
ncbi:hypothetical protein M413DRAFT_32559 [Hebeloma cylindrosporum]|uniref:Uncharacterized protein n=1 Tax=Hebeloma cylindrosporum TaxID=76867 RepID=A0A0C3BVE9_HEBCY|nr:hypothetical protein M413DRAFT_32559 [Hebeloma cylindrosporum h7]